MSAIIRRLLWIALLVHLPLVSWAELREYTVAGDSMSPALLPGDKVIVNTDVKNILQRGDLVALAFSNSSVPMIKRVAAVPGDHVDFRESAVWVNGQRTREIDMRRWRSTIKQLKRFGNSVPGDTILSWATTP
jgi:signal peptidase I